MKKLVQAPVLALLVLCLLPVPGAAEEKALPDVFLDGLQDSVRVRRDQNNVPHIFAENEHDAAFVQGWVHAEDRFFQMDFQRRTFSGTLAELVGPAGLENAELPVGLVRLNPTAGRADTARGASGASMKTERSTGAT